MKEYYDLQSIRHTVRELLAQTLGASVDEIAEDKSFFELGLTSRIGVQWMARVNEQYQLLIPAVRVYNYPTLEKLCELIYQQLNEQAGEPSSKSNIPPTARFKLFGQPESRNGSEKRISKIAASSGISSERPQRGSNSVRGTANKSKVSQAIRSAANRKAFIQKKQGLSLSPQEKNTDEAIAVVGLSGRFPGARNTAEFWHGIVEGRDSISRVNREYWSMDSVFDPKMQAGKTYSNWIGAVDGIDEFDPLFFNISPADAGAMDPQQRLFLEESWHCLEDAGYRGDRLSGERCGVFVGCGSYGQSQNGFDLSAAGFLGASPSILAARIAYLLDLRGPCLTIDTACSSSLVAMAKACDSINAGECDLALIGGVSVLANPSIHIMASQAGMLSADGRCFSFDQRANGFVPAEGIGVVALKRLSDALRDGDHIYASVIGWGINQDGRTNGITAPSQTAQAELQKSVFERFGINPRSIELVEAHGTGTKLGDPLEVEALQDAFASYTSDAGFCALGSVKSNVGHLLAAAGSAGFFKAALSLANKTLPPSIHFQHLNEHIVLNDSPFYISEQAQEWKANQGQLRRAAVSSFGFSGTNAYLVLEEVEAPRIANGKVAVPSEEVVVLSAKSQERLQAYASQLLNFLINNEPKPALSDIAYTLQSGRVPMDWRVGLVVSSLDSLIDMLEGFVQGRTQEGVFSGCVEKQNAPLTVEKGSQYLAKEFAKLWVESKQFDWSAIHHEKRRNNQGRHWAKLISLPGYPFEQRQFAMPVFKPQGEDGYQTLTPLVHHNVSTLDYVAYRSEFQGSEFFFSEHVIAGRKTLPGVAVIESALMAAVLANAGVPLGLRKLIWIQPVLVENGPIITEIRIIKTVQAVRFELYQIEKEADKLCAQGELIDSEVSQVAPISDKVGLDDALHVDDLASCYEKFDRQGFAYGRRFRNLKALYRRDRQIIGKVEFDDSARAPKQSWPWPVTRADGFYLHPGILDSAFQPCIRFCEDHDATKTYIPFSLEEIHVYAGLPDKFYSVATLKSITNDSASFSLHMVDESGRCLIHISDLTLRPVTLKKTETDDCYFYGLNWLPMIQHEADPVIANESRLFFLPQASECIVEPRGVKDIVVYPGEVFAQYSACCFTIRADKPEDYIRLWQQASLQDKEVHIGHFWSLLATNTANDSKQEVQQLEYGIYALTVLLQHLNREKQADKSRLFVFHSLTEQQESPAYVGIAGFLRSFAAETPELVARLIGLDDTDLRGSVSVASFLDREQRVLGCDAVETRYLNGHRQILAPSRLALPSRGMTPTSSHINEIGFRHQGVYIISGGSGELGKVLANKLHRDFQARVVLLGRRQLDDSLQGFDYHQVDVTDGNAVQNTVANIRQRYGQLNGVIHCAGVMDNAYLADRSKERIASVIRVKALGARHLDQATKDDRMDFFLLYSSISSIMPFVGQTDYAFANRYLDSFASLRNKQVSAGTRYGATLSINWSLWRDGGMELDEQSRLFLKRNLGLEPLNTEHALSALQTALSFASSHTLNQVAILSGDPKVIEENWHDRPMLNRSSDDNGSASTLETTDLQQLTVYNKIHTELASLLKLDTSEIEPDQNLMSYGLDSIGAMMLINQINDLLGLSVQPTALLQQPTLNRFVHHIVTEHLDELPQEPSAKSITDGVIAADASTLEVATEYTDSTPEVESSNVFDGVGRGERGRKRRDPFLGELKHLVELSQENDLSVLPDADSSLNFPLTCGQKALWFINKLNPSSSAYHIAITFRIRDAVDHGALAATYYDVLARHEVLRMRFDEDQGVPVQVLRKGSAFDLKFSELAEHLSDDELRQILCDHYNQPFNLNSDALSRMHVMKAKDQGTVILWVVHHIVADAWSVWVMLDELLSSYHARLTGSEPDLTPVTATLAESAREEATFLSSEMGAKQLAFWQQQLQGEPPVLNLPTDYPRPKVQSFEGKSLPFICDQALSTKTLNLALQHGVTPFTLLLSSYQAFLCRWSDSSRVWVGSPVSGRLDQRYVSSVGNFINSVVFTADIRDTQTFSMLLEQQKGVVASALEHQKYPFSRLVEHLNPNREGGRTPLFQAEFVYQKSHQADDLIRILSPVEPAEIVHKGIRLESVPFTQQEGQLDIALEMMEMDGRLVGTFKFNASLFSSETMAQIQQSFMRFIAQCVDSPDAPIPALNQLKVPEGGSILSGSEFALPSQTVAELFEQQVIVNRTKQAVVCAGETATYESLNYRANQIARYLRQAGLKTGQHVAVFLPRSIDLVAALLAVIKAGGTYIPIDPAFPTERIGMMLQDSSPALLLTHRSLTLAEKCIPQQTQSIDLVEKHAEIDRCDGSNLGVALSDDSSAYVIFTSGSTGRPKGVQIPHRALTNFLLSMQDKPGIDSNDRLLAVTTISFDIAGLELFLPLVSGATTIIATKDEARDGLALKQLLTRYDITVMQATPVTWNMLMEAGWEGKGNLNALCGGEAMPGRLAADLQKRTASVWNLYGPTETTIWSCIHSIQGDYAEHAVPIGTPIGNTKVRILNAELTPVPVGDIGQLYIGGVGVADGYLGREDLTQERFIEMGGEIFYRTGDCVRLTHDGVMTFHGREDQQVKINGFRIETGEIEHHLGKLDEVSDCVVCVENDQLNACSEFMLVAYVIPSQRVVSLSTEIQDALRNKLNEVLPSYMVPSIYKSVSAFPLTPNNKIDRKRLSKLALMGTKETIEPLNDDVAYPKRLKKLWCDVLRMKAADSSSHFFHSGGSSLTATRLIYRISEEFSVTPPVSLLFEHPVLGDFTNALAEYLPEDSQRKNTSALSPQEIVSEANEEHDQHLLDILSLLSDGTISIGQAQQMMED